MNCVGVPDVAGADCKRRRCNQRHHGFSPEALARARYVECTYTHIERCPKQQQQQQQQASDSGVPTFVASPFLMDPSWQPKSGAAQRRRGRRQRAAWRHEQQSIAQAVAVATHHSALRRQKTATAEATNIALRRPVWLGTPSSSRCTRKSGGTRLDRLAGVRPQVRVLQRTVEQIVDPVPVIPLLHDVEPQMVEQLVDVLSPFDLQLPEQCIEVPKVIIEDIPSRRSCREPQLAELLAEVPTILCFLKQTVGIPVTGARVRRRGDLHGFHTGQG